MEISPEFASLLRNRRTELWVCQRYDLLPGESPHDYDTPATEAGLRYRQTPNDTDRGFAELYWSAIWFEGANSPLLRTLREVDQSATASRRLVVLASEADANAEVSPESFLPAFVLPGVLDASAADSAYGTLGRRARESLAWTFARKIVQFPGTVLVVLGAQTTADLELLWDTLSSSSIRDFSVLLSWSGRPEELPRPINALIDVQIFPGTSNDLVISLIEAGAQRAQAETKSAVRIGQISVSLSPHDIQFVIKRFGLIFETSFNAPGTLSQQSLESFFNNSIDDWSCYSTGVLPVPRTYRTDLGTSLEDDIIRTLKLIGSGKAQITFIFKLPAESASGATTLLRNAAYSAAKAGFPTLVVRPEQVDIDVEDLLAFVTTLNDAAMSAGLSELPPILVVIDVEHSERNHILARQVTQSLAAQGRKAVILQAFGAEDGEGEQPSRNERWAILPTLRAAVTEDEVSDCAKCFASLAKDWSLGSGILDAESWRRYQVASKIVGPGGDLMVEALFWVALRFFVGEGSAFLQQDSLRQSLSQWIAKRISRVTSEDSRQLIKFVAALTSFRVVSPLMPILRPITGSAIPSSVVSTLRELGDIVDWKDYSPDLHDQVLIFRHPAIANEYLNSIDVKTEEQAVFLVRPVISKLSPGGKADLWLAEMLAASVLTPTKYQSRLQDWSWRLNAFEWIPLSITERSKVILHHWARCLSRSTNSDFVSAQEKNRRLTLAINKLEKALSLERRPGRDEHPGYIYNTLGGVYAELASFLESQEADKSEVDYNWDKACNAFERSLALTPGENVIAYLAFSNRLLRRARVWPNILPVESDQALKDIARAIALLDDAEEAISRMAASEPAWLTDLTKYKFSALRSLGGEDAAQYIEQLKGSDNPSLGYYCEARLMSGDGSNPKSIDAAVDILTSAMKSSIDLGPDALRLLVQLMRKSARYSKEFSEQLQIYRKLEHAGGTGLNTVDMFRFAVLCYQTGVFDEGKVRFRKIREIVRQTQASNAPPRLTDYWQDSKGKVRHTQVRVDKVISDWRGEGYVDAISQTVPLRPRHFVPLARLGEIRECIIRFDISGPLSVPIRHDRSSVG